MIQTYDAKNVSVIVNNVYLTGFSEDIVEIEKDEDTYDVKVGAQGDVVRTRNNNPLGTIKVTLQASSPQVPMLDKLANAGTLVPVSVISSGANKETSTASQAFLTKPSARKYGKQADDREYEFKCLDLTIN
ncbi:Protein of unknown function [Paenibacillus sp. UNC496MF]|uniref:phage structural protein n=1 Tax=Paenibacillus sp. UNC496MF TaxID=1502753 RepID=UPI0008E840F3|nr:phage protein [Paenibacillus sp. UNC496MF]SFJ44243.1 Protein of unknown function [Paenibacillus sp. UNC496MF]